MVGFETGKWILSHPGKYNLSQSGMSGRINLEKYFKSCGMENENVLKEKIGALNNEPVENVVITHGATEALFLTLYYLRAAGKDRYSVIKPEYEPLIKDPPALGFEYGENSLFVFSNTNNPTGTVIKVPGKYDTLIVDETFLQFYTDLDFIKYAAETYRINTFTKFYGGDDVRVGYIIAPTKQDAERINSLKGIFTEQVSKYNVCVANSILKDNDEIKKIVRDEMSENLSYLKRNMGKLKFYKNEEPVTGTVTFIDYSAYSKMDSISMAEYLSKNSISVVPGNIFGVSGPYIRVCYTRENFKESFDLLREKIESSDS